MGSCASVRGQVLISLEEKTNPVSHQRDPRSPISFVSNQGNWLSSPLATNSPTLQRQQLSWSPNAAAHQVVLLGFFSFTVIKTAQEDGVPIFLPLHPHPSLCTPMSIETPWGLGVAGGGR